MSTRSKTSTEQPTGVAPQSTDLAARRPTHCLFRVIGEGKSATWTPIGAAWPNKDGLGFNVSCDLVPLQGRIIMRVASYRDDTEANGGPHRSSDIAEVSGVKITSDAPHAEN